jgi:hypothetical protein
MECAFCGEEDEQKLFLSTRVVGDKVVHIEMCLACWWVERSEWEKKIKNGKTAQREKPRKQKQDTALPALTKPFDL